MASEIHPIVIPLSYKGRIIFEHAHVTFFNTFFTHYENMNGLYFTGTLYSSLVQKMYRKGNGKNNAFAQTRKSCEKRLSRVM